jgi:hypothetical protein
MWGKKIAPEKWKKGLLVTTPDKGGHYSMQQLERINSAISTK